jgi:hypothetical protein
VGRLLGGSELFAIHLTLFLPIACGAALSGETATRRVAMAAVSIGALALVLSFSRSAWVGGFASLLVVSALVAWRGGSRSARAVAVTLAALGFGGVLVVVADVSLPGVPESYMRRLSSLGSAGLFADRAEEWGRAFPVLRSSPIVGRPDAPNCYNILLGLASQSGLPILIPFVWLVVAGFRGALRGLVEHTGLAAGLVGAIIGLLVTGIGESSLGARVMPEVGLLIGMTVGLGGTALPSGLVDGSSPSGPTRWDERR